jgi:leucyl aminopeptidase
MYNGKTVEIGNTDAEWRLILADTLHYVEQQYKPTYVFDFATLTGAQIVATGTSISAILWRNSKLNQQFQQKSFELKDRVRELPYFEPYFRKHKSEIADMNNHGGRMGPGSITAGLFLWQFISMDNRVHFDIAGPSFQASDPLTGHGATGCMIRLMVDFLEK